MRCLTILLMVIITVMSACVSKKSLTYFKKTSDEAYAIQPASPYLIQQGDNLHIEIKSIDPSASSIYNLQKENVNLPYNRASINLNSYAVHKDGTITLPLIGSIQVDGLTIDEIKIRVQQELEQHLKDVTVFIKLVSIEVSVLGEVRNPGTYYINDNQVNIFEALSMAGDLTDMGNRKKIKVLRTTGEETIAHEVSIADASSLTSEIYHLHPHDVVYVEPIRLKPFRLNLTPVTVFLSGVSAVLLAIRLIRE